MLHVYPGQVYGPVHDAAGVELCGLNKMEVGGVEDLKCVKITLSNLLAPYPTVTIITPGLRLSSRSVATI